jgi:acetamidase/formamidase
MRFLLIPLLTLAANGADYQLKATPGTVVWGYYWSAAKPVLRIKSGDRVEIQTLVTNSPEAAAGLKAEDIEAELKAIYAEVKDKGPGGHILTGPIFVEGAEPGDTLETEALKMAVREAIDFLVTEKHPSREDAYMLCSTAVDFNVTQAVDGTKGVHAMIPKSIFK